MGLLAVFIGMSIFATPGQNPSNASVMLEDVRRTAVEYNITFDSVLQETPQGPEPSKLKLYSDSAAWPRLVTLVNPPRDAVTSIRSDGRDYAPKAEACLYFSARCALKLKPENYQTILLNEGLDRKGNIASGTYVTVCSKGPIDGNVTFTSYGDLFVWGNVDGNVFSSSYFGGYVSGDVKGVVNLDSSCTLYVRGRVTGTLRLGNGRSKAWIDGKTKAGDLKHFEGNGHVWLTKSDMKPGDHTFGDLKVTVLKGGWPKEAPRKLD